MNWFHILLLLAVVGGLGYILIWAGDVADAARRDRAARGGAMSGCRQVGKWIGGCQFGPRYDKSEPVINGSLSGATTDHLDAFRRITYVCDVCVTCGRTIKRDDPPQHPPTEDRPA